VGTVQLVAHVVGESILCQLIWDFLLAHRSLSIKRERKRSWSPIPSVVGLFGKCIVAKRLIGVASGSVEGWLY